MLPPSVHEVVGRDHVCFLFMGWWSVWIYAGFMRSTLPKVIAAQRVTQAVNDNAGLLPMDDQVQRRCGSPPERVLADSGLFSAANLEDLENRNIEFTLAALAWHLTRLHLGKQN